MLFSAALVVMVVMAMATLLTEEISTQATSVGMVALLLVTTAMVALEEMPLVVSQVIMHGQYNSQPPLLGQQPGLFNDMHVI